MKSKTDNEEGRRTKPKIDKAEPMRFHFNSAREAPKFGKSMIEHEDPTLEYRITDKAEDRRAKRMSDSELPMQVASNKESAAPSRAIARIDIADPNLITSITDIVLPTLVRPKMAKVDPIGLMTLTLRDEPKCNKSNTDTEDPIRL